MPMLCHKRNHHCFMRDTAPMKSASSVWIVQHDESPDNTILGVFATRNEASTLAEEIKAQLENGIVFARLTLSYRFDDNSAR